MDGPGPRDVSGDVHRMLCGLVRHAEQMLEAQRKLAEACERVGPLLFDAAFEAGLDEGRAWREAEGLDFPESWEVEREGFMRGLGIDDT